MSLCKSITALAASITVICPALGHAQSCQGEPTANRLDVEIEGVRSAKGLMNATLYAGDPAQFLKKNGAVKVWTAPAASPVTHMCIWLKWGPGTYALAVYHDANANGRWDHNLLGTIEGFGFSNNPHVVFSAPSFDQAKFEARGAQTTLHVRLRYP